jgi:hypothetical protein
MMLSNLQDSDLFLSIILYFNFSYFSFVVRAGMYFNFDDILFH